MSKFTFSLHALQRCKERCPKLDPYILLQSAKRLTRFQRQLVKQSCKEAAEDYMNFWNGRYFLIAKARWVFVIASDDNIICTVLDIKDKELVCKHCNKKFANYEDLRQHSFAIHLEQEI